MGAGAPARMFQAGRPNSVAGLSIKNFRRIVVTFLLAAPIILCSVLFTNPEAVNPPSPYPILNALQMVLSLIALGLICIVTWGLAYFVWNIRVPSRLNKFFADF